MEKHKFLKPCLNVVEKVLGGKRCQPLLEQCFVGFLSETVWGKLLVGGPVARETARRFIICKSRQIGDSESEFLKKGKIRERWESKLAEKLYDRRKAVPAGLCAQGREEAIISPTLSLSLPPFLSISPSPSLPGSSKS